MFKTVLATLAYAAAFHFAYVAYVNPAFEYGHYIYIAPTTTELLLTYLLVVAPLAAYRDSNAPAHYGASLIFGVCYVPAQLMVLFMWRGLQQAELVILQLSLAGSMALILWASTRGLDPSVPMQTERRLKPALLALTAASLVLLVVYYRNYMRFVSFADVYELRFETNEIVSGPLIDYPVSWLSYSFLPFFLARGILRRNYWQLGLGMLGVVLIYVSTGAKAMILLPATIFGLYILSRTGRDFLFRAMMALAAGTLVVIALPDEGITYWAKSLLLVRTLGTGGWTISTYYEYFTEHGYTFYTHIRPISALFGGYPYGDLSLGQVIGIEYTGSEQANFNANFWASDAIAALGLVGIPLVTAAMCALLYLINRVGSHYSPRFVALWFGGFWLSLLNVPLTTALLSGGGAMTLLLLLLARLPRSHARMPAETSTPYVAT